jgi:hypothetical protein
MTEPSKQLAKDVAIELDRRKRRRRLLLLAIWVALIVAAALYLRCGRGWGLGGGKGTGAGSGTQLAATPNDAGPARCTIRVSADGIFVDGTKRTRDQAVSDCQKTEGAMVTVTGDARQGDWDELRAALQAVGVRIYIRGELWDGH